MDDKLGVREVCIFALGMAAGGMVREMYQRFEQKGAENRVFNAPCIGTISESKSLTIDGYETNATSGYTGPFSVITLKDCSECNGLAVPNCTTNCYHVATWNGYNYDRDTLNSAKGTAFQAGNMTPWKDMTKAPQTSCPNCCTSGSSTSSPPAGSTSGNGSSGGGSSTSSSTTSCPACDSCCPTVTCPECMDCPAPTKCDSCCPPCQNNAGQSTFLRRFFGR